MIAITLRQILNAGSCRDPRAAGWLPPDQGLDAPIGFREIVEKAGAEEAIECFSILPGYDSLKRHFAVDCAERVRPLMTDERSMNALAVARRHALGQATDEELAEARRAVLRVIGRATGHENLDAARAAAQAAVKSASNAVAWIEDFTARNSERAWQAVRLIELTEAGEWTPAAPLYSDEVGRYVGKNGVQYAAWHNGQASRPDADADARRYGEEGGFFNWK